MASKDLNDSPCTWCCGESCFEGADQTQPCQPYSLLLNAPGYKGEGENSIGYNTCLGNKGEAAVEMKTLQGTITMTGLIDDPASKEAIAKGIAELAGVPVESVTVGNITVKTNEKSLVSYTIEVPATEAAAVKKKIDDATVDEVNEAISEKVCDVAGYEADDPTLTVCPTVTAKSIVTIEGEAHQCSDKPSPWMENHGYTCAYSSIYENKCPSQPGAGASTTPAAAITDAASTGAPTTPAAAITDSASTGAPTTPAASVSDSASTGAPTTPAASVSDAASTGAPTTPAVAITTAPTIAGGNSSLLQDDQSADGLNATNETGGPAKAGVDPTSAEEWRMNKYCQQSCFDKGNAYAGDVCSPVNKTTDTTEAPEEGPGPGEDTTNAPDEITSTTNFSDDYLGYETGAPGAGSLLLAIAVCLLTMIEK